METAYRAIIEIASLIKNPKAIQEAATHLEKAFALSAQEISERERYNDLVREGRTLGKELSAKQVELEMREKELLKFENELKDSKRISESEHEAILINLEKEKNSYREKNTILERMTKELDRREAAVSKAEMAVRAKENELRAKEVDLLGREARVDAILAAAALPK